MNTTQIVLVRHGETDWNREGRFQGQLDIGLNAMGEWQAVRVGEALKSCPLAAIYSSDLSRAWRTAEQIGAAQGMAPVAAQALREQHFGVFQGLSAEEVRERWPAAMHAWSSRDPGFTPEGAESRQAFHHRCVAGVAELAEKHTGQRIALVTHGGVLDTLYRAAHGVDAGARRTWTLDNAAVSWASWADRKLRIDRWGDVSHLAERAAMGLGLAVHVP